MATVRVMSWGRRSMKVSPAISSPPGVGGFHRPHIETSRTHHVRLVVQRPHMPLSASVTASATAAKYS